MVTDSVVLNRAAGGVAGCVGARNGRLHSAALNYGLTAVHMRLCRRTCLVRIIGEIDSFENKSSIRWWGIDVERRRLDN